MNPSAPASPKDRLAAYRANGRAAATAAGIPGDRSSFPGLAHPPNAMIFALGKSLKYKTLSSAAEKLTVAKLHEVLFMEKHRTVVADAATYAMVQDLVATAVSPEASTLNRALRFSRGLPVSMKLPVLTEALSYRYWLQDTLSEDSFDDWAAAFGVAGPSMGITMRSLMDLAAAGSRPESLKYVKTADSMEVLEHKIIQQSAWSGISSDVQIYSMLEGFAARAAGLRSLDPGLLEMHVLDGQACKIVPMNMNSQEFTASVTSPFKLKEGKKVRLTDGTTFTEVDLRALRFGAGALHAVFSNPSARGAGLLMITRARKGEAPLYAVDDPFESFGAAPKNKRWLGEPVEALTGRTVPLDVIIAGAPTVD